MTSYIMKRLARFAKKAYEPPLAECRSAHVGAKYESSILAKLKWRPYLLPLLGRLDLPKHLSSGRRTCDKNGT